MRHLFLPFTVFFFLGLTSLFGQATAPSADAVSDQTLAGRWSIDLRPAPDAEPYLKEFIVQPFAEKSFAGAFYDTSFENGKINTAWGRTYFAFTTMAGKSIYYSSGYLEKGVLYGLTYCEQRDFVMPWTGTRE